MTVELTESDKLWRDQNIPNVSDSELENIIDTFVPKVQVDVNGNVVRQEEQQKQRFPLIEEATEQITRKYDFITIEENQEILYYKDGVYVSGGEILIAKELEKLFGYQLNTATLTQITEHIKRQTYHKKEELDADINIINLKNGLYDINNNKILEHTPTYLSIKQNPINYDPNAKPIRFIEFLQEVLYARDILTAVDLIAYTFHRDYDVVEALFILLGYGRNGKTVYTSVLSSLHGLGNVSNVPLKDMLEDGYALSDLENKNVNIDNELGGQSIKETAILKRLTGGSRQPVRIQRKYERAHDSILYAKLVFCANKMPVSQDNSVAHHRRSNILAFPHTFEGEKEDPNLIKKLTTGQELSGIFNMSMRALRRIRKTKQLYVNEKSVQERQEKYEMATNPVKAFCKEAISEESNESHFIAKSYVYGIYNLFCNKQGLPFDTYQNFCKNMTKQIENIRDYRPEIEGQRVQCWKGILLNPEYAPKTEQKRLL
jgi:putative DNA primase/helicase